MLDTNPIVGELWCMAIATAIVVFGIVKGAMKIVR